VSEKTLRGRIQYTGRAFHQDAMEAMKGDIVRGIIELITNSDDSYASLGDRQKQQKISVEVEHRRGQPWRVIVRDRAAGMTAKQMIERITRLGGRTSGFERGESMRGNLGRGAKDVAAFGDVSFMSIKRGRYAELILRSTGDWELAADRKATREDRKRLGVPRGSGTTVEINAMPTIRCPRHETLRRKLSTHFQLRDILSDPMRRVELCNLNDGTRDLLIYQYPDLPVVFDGNLEVDGYPDATAHLVVYRHPSRFDEGAYDPGRQIGILIKGGRAIYDNTLFKFENNIHAGWFTGKLVCPYIDKLAREHDNRLEANEAPSASNPIPIISRHREGLNASHPFVKALYASAEAVLSELIAAEEDRAKQEIETLENDRTRADLDKLAKEVAKLISEELREIEAEELPGDEAGQPPLLAIVPEVAFAYIGEDRTLTVAARNENISIGDEVAISLDPEGVVELLTPMVSLRAHKRREDVLVGQIRLRPMLEGESTLVTAVCEGRSADSIVEVRPPREVVEEEIEPPDTLTFSRPSYRIGWHKTKDLQLEAPAAVVAEFGEHAKIASSDPGVVIRTPLVRLEYDDSVEFYRAKVRVEARTLDATSVITADLGGLTATAQVKVTRKEEGTAIRIRIEPKSFGIWRAIMETEEDGAGAKTTVIKIAGRHPAIRPVLGESFQGQDTPLCRALIAEIVADIASRHVVTKLYRLRSGTEEFDADRIYREHYKRVQRFLPRFQRLLVGKLDQPEGKLAPALILEVAK